MGRFTTSEDERVDWEIEVTREAIQLDWAELARKELTADRRRAVREHLSMCNEAMKELRNRVRHREISSKLAATRPDQGSK